MAYDEESVVVSVCCITYNHAKYISQCLDGIVSQKTDFKYELIINDDCSTDGTTEIIKEYANKYPEIIKPIFHEENQWTKGIRILATFVFPKARGKYIALCEGDDYWIDPLKLQKQKEYLDNHQECGMCYTNFNIQIQETGQIIPDVARNCPKHFPMHYNSVEEFILAKGYVCPPSWFIRCELLNSIDWLENSCDGTFEMFCYFLANTTVHYDDNISSVYRILPESACQSRDVNKIIDRIKCLYSMQIKLLGKYNCSKEAFNKCTQLYYKEHLSFFMDNGFWEEVQCAKIYFTDRSVKQKIALILSDSRTGRSIYKIIRTVTRFTSSIFPFTKQYPF